MSEWSAHIGAETMAATCKNGGLNNKVLYDVVFAANQSLRPLPAEQKKAFFADCCRFYANIVQRILKKSPLNFKFVRHTSCLSPFLLNSSPALCESRMQHLLEELVRAKRLSAEQADRAKSQFLRFCQNSVMRQFQEFEIGSNRLEFFLFSDRDEPRLSRSLVRGENGPHPQSQQCCCGKWIFLQ